MANFGLVLHARTIKNLLESLRDKVHSSGQKVATARGLRQYLHGVTLVWEEPGNTSGRYPYWDERSEDWFMNAYVRPEDNAPDRENTEIILPYSYAWRARYHDQGWAHVARVTNELVRLNYSELPTGRREDIDQLVRETYKKIHPDLLMSVLAWMKRRGMHFLINEPEIVNELARSSQRDLLGDLIARINYDKKTRLRSIETFSYPNIDLFSHVYEHSPNYISFHLLPIYDRGGDPVAFDALHVHREFNALRAGQLHFAQDLEWASQIALETGIELRQIIIQAQSVYLNADEPIEDVDIITYLLRKSRGYRSYRGDVQSYLMSDDYRIRADVLLEVLQND